MTKDQLHRNFNHSGEGHNHCNIMFLSKDAQYMSALVMVDEKTRYTHLHFIDTKSFTTNKAILCFDDLCTRIWTYHTQYIQWDGELATGEIIKNTKSKYKIKVKYIHDYVYPVQMYSYCY